MLFPNPRVTLPRKVTPQGSIKKKEIKGSIKKNWVTSIKKQRDQRMVGLQLPIPLRSSPHHHQARVNLKNLGDFYIKAKRPKNDGLQWPIPFHSSHHHHQPRVN